MAKISKKDVEKIALLARIGLRDEDVEKFAGQLSDIISYVEKLQEADTKDVPITAQVTGTVNVFREDVAKPSLPVEDVLLNAPRQKNDLFVIPTVLDQE